MLRSDSYAVYTNNLPNGAFRGFGGPQGAFAAETQMNRLAEALNMDPVELRLRNVLREGALLSVRTPLPKGSSIPQVVEECARSAGWVETSNGWSRSAKAEIDSKNPAIRRGTGFACALRTSAFPLGHQKIVGPRWNCMGEQKSTGLWCTTPERMSVRERTLFSSRSRLKRWAWQ